jgi:hypothetical protein
MAGELAAGELDEELVRQLEQVARRLAAGEGQWTLEFVFTNGHFVRAHRHHGPIRREELQSLEEPAAG